MFNLSEKDMDKYNNLSEMDKALVNRAIEETNDDSKDWVIRPLIFDADNPESPISTPILSGLNFKMIGDSNVEILTSNSSVEKNLNKFLRIEMFKNLSTGVCDNIFFTIINNIIETSTLNFNAWWNYNCNKYFPDLGNCGDYYFQIFPCNRFYEMITDQDNKYYQALDETVIRFLKCTLSFKSMGKAINVTKEKIMEEGPFNPTYHEYMENTAINIANLIGIMYVDSITTFLFKQVTLNKVNPEFQDDYVISRILNSTDTIKNSMQDQLNVNNFVHTSVEYILEDSLYDLVQTYVNPSIKNILETALGTFFFMYQDMDQIIREEEKKQLESK